MGQDAVTVDRVWAVTDRWAIGRALIAFGVLAFAFWRAISDYVARDIAVGGYTYRVGDWLINYAGGFVRRGLFGELLFATTEPGAPTLWALLGFQLACYAVVLAFAVSFLHRTGYAWSAIALVCSPAALPFIGWDPEGGWRKEIICFAAIALLGWARQATGRLHLGLTTVAVCLFGLAVLSWEAAVFALPVMLFLRRLPDGRPALHDRASQALLALGVGGGVASVLFRGDQQAVWAVCRAVVARDLNVELCSGAIARLAETLPEALEAVAVRFPLYWWFIVLLPLALLPVLTSPWLRRHWPWFLAMLAVIAPLYVIAEDYGRWAYLLMMVSGLAIMAGDGSGVASRFWNRRTTLAYIALWGLPHWLFPEGPWPWLGLLHSLLVPLS